MKKWPYLVLAILVGAMLVGSVVYLGKSREPVYQGRTLSSWLTSYEYAPGMGSGEAIEAEQRYNAAAVREIGTNALPTLITWLHAKDGPLKIKFISFCRAHPKLRLNFRTADEKITMACFGFEILGPIASPAAPEVVKYFNQTGDRNKFAGALILSRIGPKARAETVPALLNFLHDDKSEPPGTLHSGPLARNAVETALKLIDPEAAAKEGVK